MFKIFPPVLTIFFVRSRPFFFYKKEAKKQKSAPKNLLLENLKNKVFDGSENP